MSGGKDGTELDLLRYFRDSLIGRNAKGIVHNMNSPLQVLSMQIELLGMDLNLLASQPCENSEVSSGIQQAIERLDQLETIVAKINHLVKLVGSRVADDEQDDDEGPIMVARLLEETIEFWKSDLFFKHKVILDLEIPSASPVVVSKERYLKDALDSVLFSCIQTLKKENDPKLHIAIEAEPDSSDIVMKFEPEGRGFPLERVEHLSSFIERNGTIKEIEELSFAPVDLALAVAKMSIKKISGDFKLNDQSIIIKLKANM